jgi:hypothetical protein
LRQIDQQREKQRQKICKFCAKKARTPKQVAEHLGTWPPGPIGRSMQCLVKLKRLMLVEPNLYQAPPQ